MSACGTDLEHASETGHVGPLTALREVGANFAASDESLLACQRISVICFGLSRAHMRRQPWHVAYGLTKAFALLGHDVELITDSDDAPGSAWFTTRQFDPLIKRGYFSKDLARYLRSTSPDRIYMITGPSELVRLRALKSSGIRSKLSLIMASARLRPFEILALGPSTLLFEWRLLARPMINALLPGTALRRGFERSGADRIYYLSPSASERFVRSGLPAGSVIQPQITARSWAEGPTDAQTRVTYFGPALELRGAFTALAAFETACARGLDARLDMLIRPDPGVDRSKELIDRARRSKWRRRISIERRDLTPNQLMTRLSDAHIFLLPFSVTISDVPLVIIEAGLSGRHLIVLNAPGVGEIAAQLGAIVVDRRSQLPNALISAARDRHKPTPSAVGWADWPAVARNLLDDRTHGSAAYRFVGIAGVDGAGKTALMTAVCRRLTDRGADNRHVWSRFRNYLSKPLLALARLTGHNRKESVDGTLVGYHDFQNCRAYAWPFLVLQIADNLIDMAMRYRQRPNQIIVSDRCILDTLVDLAIDTGFERLLFGRLGRFLIGRLPAPRLLIIVRRDRAAIAASRPDVLADRWFAKRAGLYQRLAIEFGIPVIDNDRPLDQVADDILAIANAGPIGESSGRSHRPNLTEVRA